MAEDFSKIFAQGATSKQSWTDSNYNTGWGYLGQEPPPYELFDYLFNRLDKKDKELHDTFTTFNQSWSSYVPVQRVNDTTFKVNNGNGTSTNITINNVAHAGSASTAITATPTDNSTNIANTAWVRARLSENITGLKSQAVLNVVKKTDTTFTVSKGDGTNTDIVINNVSHATSADNASYATTAPSTDNSTKIANTSFVQSLISSLVGGAPSTLNTLKELASAIGNDANFASTITNALAGKVNKSGIRYSLGDNGYIVFGPDFGNFCIQWGAFEESLTPDINTIHRQIPTAITFPSRLMRVIVSDTCGAQSNSIKSIEIRQTDKGFSLYCKTVNSEAFTFKIIYLAIGF